MAAVSESEASRYWRDKYLDLVDANERLQATSHASHDQMRRAIMMITLLAEGQSTDIDKALHDLRSALKDDAPLRHAVDDLNHALISFEDQQIHNTEVLLGQIADAANKLSKCPLPRALIKRVKSVQKNAELELRDWQGCVHQLQSWLQIADEIATLEGVDDKSKNAWWKKWFSPSDEQTEPPHEAHTANADNTHSFSLHTGTDTEANTQDVTADVVHTLQNLLSQVVVPAHLHLQLLALQERLQTNIDWQGLVPLLEDTASFLLQCLSNNQLELETFLTGIDERLTVIQTLVSATSTDHNNRKDARQDLDSEVRNHLADINSVLTGSENLGDLGARVNEHLALILNTMERYQAAEIERDQQLSERIDQLQARITEMEAETRATRTTLEETRRRAFIDNLTGLPNRDAYVQRLESEQLRAKRQQTPLSLVMTDVDFFKRINDTYGHLAGDKVLRLIARTMRASLRDVDFIARYGGEEFVILMPGITSEEAYLAAERLRMMVEKSPFSYRKERVPITVSLGVTQFQPNENPETVFNRADKALYQAKNDGRNRSVLA